MTAQTLRRLIGKTFKTRNVYATTTGFKRDRKDLIARKREYIRDCIEQVRKLETV
jgi:hypothetical protein